MSDKRPSVNKQQSLSVSSDPSASPSVYVSPKLLERRSTGTLSRSAELRHESSPFKDTQTSQLKRFTESKESISRIFTRIHKKLDDFKSFVASEPTVAHKVS